MEEENLEQTYCYETNPNSEQLLKIKKKELKELKKKAASDRIVRLANNSQKRAIRDDKLDKINLKLKTIKEKMVTYNRMGKVEKNRTDILKVISNLIQNDVELAEEIERSKFREVSQEDVEVEAVDESELSLEN